MKPISSAVLVLGLATTACSQSAPEPWRAADPVSTLDLRTPTLPARNVVTPARFVADPGPSTAPGNLWFMRGAGESPPQQASFEAPPPPPIATVPVQPVQPVIGPRNGGWRRRIRTDGCRDRAAPPLVDF